MIQRRNNHIYDALCMGEKSTCWVTEYFMFQTSLLNKSTTQSCWNGFYLACIQKDAQSEKLKYMIDGCKVKGKKENISNGSR